MVVVAIVAILVAIAVPAYGSYVQRTKIRMAQGDLLALTVKFEHYRQRTLAYPDATAQADVIADWLPEDGDFHFEADSADAAGYQITATALESLGSAEGCKLTIDSDGDKTSDCPGATWQ